ncbi:MAG TPA: four helix bundle protein [Xanthomonadaceae bacterium]
MTQHHHLPPIAKLATRFLVEIENAVRGFPRYHKYALGTDLRRQAMQLVVLCNRAWRDRGGVVHWVNRLVWAIDEIKIALQLGSQIRAFRSFGVFEQLIRMAEDIGRQAGGWKRQLQQHPNGQNPAASGRPERAKTLSARTASATAGANP